MHIACRDRIYAFDELEPAPSGIPDCKVCIRRMDRMAEAWKLVTEWD